MRGALILLLFLVAFASNSPAHEVRPAYLEIREITSQMYNVLWKVPGKGDGMRLGLYVEFPADTKNVTEPRATTADNIFAQRWTVQRVGGLTGGTIHIAGLSATMTDVLVRLERRDGTTQVTRLTPSAPSFVVEAVPQAVQVSVTYLKLGIQHILGGIDHLLFVLALLILVKGNRRLIVTVTAFTLAHSLTLASATLGLIRVPGPPIEAIIALSIVFIATEIVHSRQGGQDSVTEKFPWIIAFIFGLLHGFGFAGALSEVGLPQSAIPVALLFFNIGVEIGQLLFIAFIVIVARQGKRYIRFSQAFWTWHIPSYAIGSIAMFWAIQRISSF